MGSCFRRCWAGMRRAVGAACLAAVLAVVAAAPLAAASLDLSNLVLNNHDGRILVRFGLAIPDLTPLETVFAEGGVLALRMDARLSEKSDYLWDHQVAEAARMAVIRKTGAGYVVEPAPAPRPGKSGAAPATPAGEPAVPLASGTDLTEVLRQAFGEVALDLGAWEVLKRGESYVLGLGISLVRGDVSAFWRNTLFFWSFDVIPKARYRLDFTY